MAQNLQVLPVACLRDNYAYLVFDWGGTGDAVVVDPSEAGPVSAELEQRGLRLAAILNTHHHHDHVGGNLELAARYGCPVFAHTSDAHRVPGFSRGLEDAEVFVIAGFDVKVLHIPGHTLGAIAYCFEGACLTGDTLFCGGCGRLFEGTAAMMHESLERLVRELSDETLVYCGHEYTESNLAFAMRVLPHPVLEERLSRVKAERAAGRFCASATMKLEKATNPFLRCHLPEMKELLEKSTAAEAFAELRRRKDVA